MFGYFVKPMLGFFGFFTTFGLQSMPFFQNASMPDYSVGCAAPRNLPILGLLRENTAAVIAENIMFDRRFVFGPQDDCSASSSEPQVRGCEIISLPASKASSTEVESDNESSEGGRLLWEIVGFKSAVQTFLEAEPSCSEPNDCTESTCPVFAEIPSGKVFYVPALDQGMIFSSLFVLLPSGIIPGHLNLVIASPSSAAPFGLGDSVVSLSTEEAAPLFDQLYFAVGNSISLDLKTFLSIFCESLALRMIILRKAVLASYGRGGGLFNHQAFFVLFILDKIDFVLFDFLPKVFRLMERVGISSFEYQPCACVFRKAMSGKNFRLKWLSILSGLRQQVSFDEQFKGRLLAEDPSVLLGQLLHGPVSCVPTNQEEAQMFIFVRLSADVKSALGFLQKLCIEMHLFGEASTLGSS